MFGTISGFTLAAAALGLQLVFVVAVLLRPRTRQSSSMAWILVIVVLPVAGIILYLIVGEVRTGQAAFALFRALMSDHAGGTTFHASSAHDALGRLGLIMFADKGVAMHAGRQITLSAIDLIVQIGIRDGVRRILNIHELRHPRDRKQGDGDLLPLWHLGEDPERMPPIRRQRDGTAPT